MQHAYRRMAIWTLGFLAALGPFAIKAQDAAPAPGTASGNLLANPGFETQGDEWKVWGTWDTMTDAERASVLTFDSSFAHSGVRAAKITDSWTDHGPYVVQFVPIDPKKVYRLSVWARAEYPTTATIGMQYHRNEAYLNGLSRPIRVRDTWKQYTLVATGFPEGTNRVSVMLSPTAGDAGATTDVWFDDVSLAEEKDETALKADMEVCSTPVDLRSAANMGFKDDTADDRAGGWFDQGVNDLREFPTGKQFFQGIPFTILNPAENDGKSCVVLQGEARPYFPAEVAIPVGATAASLYFLQGAAWGNHGDLAATYCVEYEDGQTAEIPVRPGKEVADWWRPSASLENARIAWRGGNAECDDVGVYLFAWNNPSPEKPIRRLVLRSARQAPVFACLGITRSLKPSALTSRPSVEEQDTSQWFPYPMPWKTFPVDVSFLLDAPAGKHGFVTVKDDGHFYFEDGTRARFWGTNIHSADGLFPTKEQAEQVAATLAKAGVNIVRTHLLENPSPHGLTDSSQPDSQHLSPEQFDKFDYFVAKLKEKGIYMLPDMMPMCSRQFKEGDALPEYEDAKARTSHGAKGLGTFNARIIELGKKYARDFLAHRNPYTGLRYAEEPSIAMVQLTNEDSIFLWFGWGDMPRLNTYMTEFNGLWNTYLAGKYATRDALAKAWTNQAGECALQPDEAPENGTVKLPPLNYFKPREGRAYTGTDSPARVNEALLFLNQVAADHYRTMTQYLRELGLKVPVTGSNIVCNLASLQADMATDYVDHHVYWQHVGYGGNSSYGRQITLVNTPLLRHDPVETGGFVNSLSIGKVRGKPLIVTEWASMWPSEFRSADMLTTAAYACLQDWDMLLYYCYMGGWGYTWDQADKGLKDMIPQPTVAFADPAAVGLFPATALIFHRHDVKAAERLVEVGYSAVDGFYGQSQYLDPKSALHFLPYISRVRQHFFATDYDPPRDGVDVVVASGNSASGNYAAAPRAILSTDNPAQDLYDHALGKAALWQALYPAVRQAQSTANTPVVFKGWPWATDRKARGTFDLFETASLPPGAQAIGADSTGSLCLGFRDDRHVVMPSLASLRGTYPDFFARLYTQAATAWGVLPDGRGYREDNTIVSDTGELVRDHGRGLFRIDTPRTQGAAGFLSAVPVVELSDLTLVSRTDYATVTLSALDDKPLRESARLLLTTVARAQNTGQKFRQFLNLDERLESSGHGCVLVERGTAPVIVQPVELDVTFRTQLTGKTPVVYAIDVQGNRAKKIEAAVADGKVSFKTGKDAATIYYQITFE